MQEVSSKDFLLQRIYSASSSRLVFRPVNGRTHQLVLPVLPVLQKQNDTVNGNRGLPIGICQSSVNPEGAIKAYRTAEAGLSDDTDESVIRCRSPTPHLDT